MSHRARLPSSSTGRENSSGGSTGTPASCSAAYTAAEFSVPNTRPFSPNGAARISARRVSPGAAAINSKYSLPRIARWFIDPKRVKTAWCQRESKPAIGLQSRINLIAHVDHDVIKRRNRQYRGHEKRPPLLAGADSIATAGGSPAPHYVDKMTALRRAPPSLGGKRHAAMAGSHPPRRRHCADPRHVKLTVASGMSPLVLRPRLRWYRSVSRRLQKGQNGAWGYPSP